MMPPVAHHTGSGTLVAAPMPGNIVSLRLRMDGRELDVLHRAPWADEHAVPSTLMPVERHLSGDFFCAPFGMSDDEETPPHGWPANSEWDLLSGEAGLRFALRRTVMGARIEKTMVLAPDAPVLYQEHVIAGGSGHLPVAHHPMVRAAAGGSLAFSQKQTIVTPENALDPGRTALVYPGRNDDPHAFPGVNGPVDLCRLPIAERSEDFVVLVERRENTLGWSAVLRDAEDDIVFILKDPAVLPVTMMWHSNAGRDQAPWSGRHDRVLGIEDGCTGGPAGNAAIAPEVLAELGVATGLDLAPDRTHRIAHVIGAIPRPRGWSTVSDIAIEAGQLVLSAPGGDTRAIPFDTGFFSRSV